MLLLFLAQVCVGTNIVLSKGLLNHIHPIIILTLRFSLAGIFILLLLIRSKEKDKFKLTLTGTEWSILLASALGAGVLFNFGKKVYSILMPLTLPYPQHLCL